MTPKPNYSDPAATSSARLRRTLVVEAEPFVCSFAEFSAWLDERLDVLESAMADFRTPKSISLSLRRS